MTGQRRPQGSGRDIRVLRGDSMRVLPRLPAGIADLVLTDPPYGIGYESTLGATVANDDAPFVWWLREAWRITKPTGALLCFCRWDVQEAFRWAAELAGWQLKSQVIWHKPQGGMGDLKRQFSPNHEVIWFATRSKAFAFPNGRPGSVITVNPPHWKHRTHPTEKPVDLLRQLITATTRPGDVIVDPFAGTGATAVACKVEGRSCVTVEMEAKYCSIARRRVRLAGRSPASPPS